MGPGIKGGTRFLHNVCNGGPTDGEGKTMQCRFDWLARKRLCTRKAMQGYTDAWGQEEGFWLRLENYEQ